MMDETGAMRELFLEESPMVNQTSFFVSACLYFALLPSAAIVCCWWYLLLYLLLLLLLLMLYLLLLLLYLLPAVVLVACCCVLLLTEFQTYGGNRTGDTFLDGRKPENTLLEDPVEKGVC